MQMWSLMLPLLRRSRLLRVPALRCCVCRLQRIQFARTKSDAVAKLDGSYKPDKERSKKSAAARGA
jgi:hypothetical protein